MSIHGLEHRREAARKYLLEEGRKRWKFRKAIAKMFLFLTFPVKQHREYWRGELSRNDVQYAKLVRKYALDRG